MRRQASLGAFWLFLLGPIAGAQVIERPVPFDSAAIVMVLTPRIAERATLGPPSWPVSGDFTEARLYTVTDSTYILTVRRSTGVVERYNLSAADRHAIRVSVSRLPPDVVRERNDAGNAFIRNQSLLGLALYAPAFSYAIGEDNAAGFAAGYLVVAGGTFFAASEVARRMFISRAQNDLSANTGLNGGLGTATLIYILGGGDRARAAGAFAGGLAGTGIGLALGRGMTEAEAVGAGFGSHLGALIGWGTVSTLDGEPRCTVSPEGFTTCNDRISDKAKAFTVLASGLVGYPLGVLYPKNSNYNVTPGDIQMLWPALGLGVTAGASLLPDNPQQSVAWAALTLGGIAGVLAGDMFLVRRADHSRTDASRVTLGTGAGELMGLGVAALIDNDLGNPQMAFALMTLGGVMGLIVTERTVDPRPDAGRQRIRVTFNPSALAMLATGTSGMHSLFTVRF
ncbi:MAG TPA: hypothetical protein VFS56_06085 [Gemmatimonadaceae bacterium]|nr:hypothetical protein [Gemmatimonadaceae bacterium]